MELFTFIMAYLGGSYISQVEARDEVKARDIWIRTLKTEEIEFFTAEDQENIIKEKFVDDDLAPIEGMKNVWFFMVETKKGFGHVNLIKTKL